MLTMIVCLSPSLTVRTGQPFCNCCDLSHGLHRAAPVQANG